MALYDFNKQPYYIETTITPVSPMDIFWEIPVVKLEPIIEKIVATADLHGYLPDKIDLTEKYLAILIAGDVTPGGSSNSQQTWLRNKMRPWVRDSRWTHFKYIAGNHDSYFDGMCPDWVGGYFRDNRAELTSNVWFFRRHEINTIKVWGSPWSPPFRNWSFMLPEEALGQRYAAIPHNSDIILSHCPPHGILDENMHGEHCGSTALRERIKKIQEETKGVYPSLCIFGHIHEQGGKTQWFNNTLCANVSYVDFFYKPANPPMVFEFDMESRKVINYGSPVENTQPANS